MGKKVSNLVKKKTLKEIQLSVLEEVSDAVMNTAGPYGSNTMILKDNLFPTYSKDGKKVLDSIKYYGCIETGILDELSQLTSYVVKEVGDGTTSAIRLSFLIFKELIAMERASKSKSDITPNDIITSFQKITKKVQAEILKHKRDITLDDIYKICMISTNGNEEVSKNIADIYNKYGLDVYIDLGTSNSADHILKEYDGVTLEKGYSTNAYINSEDTGKCIVRNANVYYFRDPINTPEMLAFFTNIVYNNVLIPFSGQKKDAIPVPTVIFAPSISRDAEVILSDIETALYSQKPINRPEFLVITKLNRYAQEVDDIAKLCGCKPIMNYIDPTVQKKDQENGKAPTIENILTFCGHAEAVEADSSRTKFINPSQMYTIDENGDSKPSDIYTGLVASVEAELENAKENDDDAVTITMLKRRLSSLKSDLVQYLIGGISVADRDACKDLAEDAILNCRSAITSGVGYGMCFEGFRASADLYGVESNSYSSYSDTDKQILKLINDAYFEFMTELLKSSFGNDEGTIRAIITESIVNGMPINIKTKIFDGLVLSSINTDVVILDAISKIVTIMFTSNQCLIPDSLQNTYESLNK